MTGRPYELIKRAIDIGIAAAAAVLTGPLLAAIAVAIKIEDRGHVILRQHRVGLNGEDFELLKFRTMVDNAHLIGAGWLIADSDPRITRVGRFLRRWSLDELPQMFNVLRGDMSIIGPRPTLRYQVEQYTEFQRRRLDVLPGITGWAQVSGRNSLTWQERIERDVWYVEHRSLALDLRILARTVPLLARPSNVYNDARADWGEVVEAAVEEDREHHVDVARQAEAS
jgi:lipopolysaccharide/colanic/teichoic acid biosynthesis glycosyltransferase